MAGPARGWRSVSEEDGTLAESSLALKSLFGRFWFSAEEGSESPMKRHPKSATMKAGHVIYH